MAQPWLPHHLRLQCLGQAPRSARAMPHHSWNRWVPSRRPELQLSLPQPQLPDLRGPCCRSCCFRTWWPLRYRYRQGRRPCCHSCSRLCCGCWPVAPPAHHPQRLQQRSPHSPLPQRQLPQPPPPRGAAAARSLRYPRRCPRRCPRHCQQQMSARSAAAAGVAAGPEAAVLGSSRVSPGKKPTGSVARDATSGLLGCFGDCLLFAESWSPAWRLVAKEAAWAAHALAPTWRLGRTIVGVFRVG